MSRSDATFGEPIAAEDALQVMDHAPDRFFYVLDRLARMDRNLLAALEGYLHATLAAPVTDLDTLLEWLRGCEYVDDRVQFGASDVWIRPDDFERLRRGDCEDHAIYAWVWLTRLGYEARLVDGSLDSNRRTANHVWVAFRDGRRWIVLESTAKNRAGMTFRLGTVPGYVAHWSFDAQLTVYRHRH